MPNNEFKIQDFPIAKPTISASIQKSMFAIEAIDKIPYIDKHEDMPTTSIRGCTLHLPVRCERN